MGRLVCPVTWRKNAAAKKIAITLLALELKVPQLGLVETTRIALAAGVASAWPSYFAFVILRRRIDPESAQATQQWPRERARSQI
jgi:hypothetical protein